MCISDEPSRKPVPVHEQTVKDEKGRYKRFHGAFTGGFSAGYFNTVGTKEGKCQPCSVQQCFVLTGSCSLTNLLCPLGWAPSTFISTRQQKAERQNARPEDFMDEEVSVYESLVLTHLHYCALILVKSLGSYFFFSNT